MASSYQLKGQVRDSSPSPRGFSKSQLCLHKILRVIASSAPPPLATTASSNQASSSSSALPDVVSEKDNTCVDRGIGIDLNMEFSLGCGGEGNKPVSAGCAPEGDDKGPHFSGRPGTAAEEEELAGTGSGEYAAVVDQRSSEGEFDPNYSNDGGGGGCNSPTNLLMNESQEIGINGNSDEDDDKREVGDQERREVQNDSRRADEESKVAETATCEGAVGGRGGGESYYCNDNGNSRTADRRLTVLIEAAELASSTTSDPDETPTTTAEEEEESPSARSRGGGILLTKRKRRSNKCWVVDLYRDDTQMRTAALAPAVSRTKRGRRSQVLPSRYRDSSMVMEPWKPPPRRRS